MKKLLVLASLLICFCMRAQNTELLHKMDNCDLDAATEFADAIANSFRVKYERLDSRYSKRGDVYSIIYLPASMMPKNKEAIKDAIEKSYSREFECDSCLSVHYNVINEGENKDLEIKGTKKYHFTFTRGKFLDLFNFWVKYVNPNAIASEVSNKGIDSQRDFKNNQYWYNFATSKDSGKWYIKNYTDRLNEFK
ncbi:hypothetical protein QWY99_22065 [Flavobacterium branchiarum]|uniref:Uncharacterized protein n=1 Tax=Flavobacterium branchiarum TaxID=1114870 RepID=A0ABV5FMP3_9FLAO|nr:hypothetical protein [Flavobacterium branchiarum]MDN3675723.1 hypothetical protein [Flavobacterium branchiarum]